MGRGPYHVVARFQPNLGVGQADVSAAPDRSAEPGLLVPLALEPPIELTDAGVLVAGRAVYFLGSGGPVLLRQFGVGVTPVGAVLWGADARQSETPAASSSKYLSLPTTTEWAERVGDGLLLATSEAPDCGLDLHRGADDGAPPQEFEYWGGKILSATSRTVVTRTDGGALIRRRWCRPGA